MATLYLPDRLVALCLAPLVLVILALLFLIVVPLQGRPFIFASERMRRPGEPFLLLKVRTMHPPDPAAEQAVMGGDLAGRVTRIGRLLRTTRLDELPQILNVLKGEIRFIGPRPPLRKYVEANVEQYARLLDATPPGITGLATVMLHAREERLLSACSTAAETDAVYRRRCIPLKMRLDLIYARRRSPGLDLLILWRTVSRLTVPVRWVRLFGHRNRSDRRAPFVRAPA